MKCEYDESVLRKITQLSQDHYVFLIHKKALGYQNVWDNDDRKLTLTLRNGWSWIGDDFPWKPYICQKKVSWWKRPFTKEFWIKDIGEGWNVLYWIAVGLAVTHGYVLLLVSL